VVQDHMLEEAVLFLLDDCEAPRSLGHAVLLKEREATMTAGDPGLYAQHRCLLFKVENDTRLVLGQAYTYLVAAVSTKIPVMNANVGQWTDSKTVSAFYDLASAEQAYARYGPSDLIGDRVTSIQFIRTSTRDHRPQLTDYLGKSYGLEEWMF